MYYIFFVVGLLNFCNGDRLSFNKTCRYNLVECGFSSELYIQVEEGPNSCKTRSVTLTFMVSEERGRPCLQYGPDRKTFLRDNCLNPNTEFDFQSFENGTHIFNISYNVNETRYFRISGHSCQFEGCGLSINSSIFGECGQPTSTAVDSSFNHTTATSVVFTKEDIGISPVALSMILVIIILILLLFLVYFGYKSYKKRKTENSKFYETDIVPISPLTVFLVFLDEHPDHKSVVLRFATYLKRRFGFKIILELYNRETIYENPASWLEESLSNSDVVLVIWSPGAKERWHNPEKYTGRLDLYTPVLKRIKNEISLHKSLSKYMFGYFEYCTNNDIPKLIQNSSIPCIKLMREFNSFCHILADVANKSNNQSHIRSKVTITKKCLESIFVEATALEKCISEMYHLTHNGKTWETSNTDYYTTLA